MKKWIAEGRPTVSGEPTDINDESEDGYDYYLIESMHDNLRATLRKAYNAHHKVEGYEQFELIGESLHLFTALVMMDIEIESYTFSDFIHQSHT